jgi:hypothetical protein
MALQFLHGEDANEKMGNWNAISRCGFQFSLGLGSGHRFYQKVVSSGEKRFPFGEKIVGRSMYTKEGTFCTMATGVERKQGAGAPTDEERIGLFKSIYAYCGTYRVEGAKLMGQPDVAWTPNWAKHEHNATWKVEGKKLTVETLPFKSQLDGAEVVAVVEYDRD